MRKILFRGLHIIKDEFVYGVPLQTKSGLFIMPEGIPMTVQVRPGTVDQYIGVDGFIGPWEEKDDPKNIVMLFENDIVEVVRTFEGEDHIGIFKISFRSRDEPGFKLVPRVDKNGQYWKIEGYPRADSDEMFDYLCLLGNMHQNPKLYPKRK